MADEEKKSPSADAGEEKEEASSQEVVPEVSTKEKAEEQTQNQSPSTRSGAPVGDDGVKKEAPKEEAEEFDMSQANPQQKTFIEQVEKMSVLELHELVKILEKRFGVSAQAVAVAGPGAEGADAGSEEKSTFDVELKDGGAQKIQVIKVVKEVLGLGLKEAKDMVDGTPTILKQGVKKDEAEEIKKKIEEAGGQVTLN